MGRFATSCRCSCVLRGGSIGREYRCAVAARTRATTEPDKKKRKKNCVPRYKPQIRRSPFRYHTHARVCAGRNSSQTLSPVRST